MLALIPSLLQASVPSSYTNAQEAILPILFLALFVDACVVAIWYLLGVLLHNNRIRESAKGEYYQFIGTAFMTLFIILGITVFSTIFYTLLGGTVLMSPTALNGMCTNIRAQQTLDILNGQTGSLLFGATATGSQHPLIGICSIVQNTNGAQTGATKGKTDVTETMDYPLAASGVIVANMTNQMAIDYNDAFEYNGFLSFLSQVSPEINVCIAIPGKTTGCFVPIVSFVHWELSISYKPYGGYTLLLQGLSTLGALMSFSLESYVVQLVFLSMMLLLWPWLLFAGLVLRSNFVTRKLGGLLMAVAIGMILIFPLVYCGEYLALGNGVPSVGTTLVTLTNGNTVSSNIIYGFNSTTGLPAPYNAVGVTTPAPYALNFFVLPRYAAIVNSNNCLPGGDSNNALNLVYQNAGQTNMIQPVHSLALVEFVDTAKLLIPADSVISGITQLKQLLSGNSNPSFPLFTYNCNVGDALNTEFELFDAYGIIGVSSYFLPIVNIIITLTAIIGLSGLFGGDTELAGLARFI